MDDGSGLAEALLGLDGFRVLEVIEGTDELVVTVESAVQLVGCSRCGVRAEAQDRMPIDIRDLTCFGRPARLVWIKRRWRCVDADCDAKTWTEHSDHVDAQAVLTRRAGAEACRQVGEEARPVSRVAAELGVCWWTVMNAVIEHGTPLVDDPTRIGAVTQLGVDETSFLRANRAHATVYATGLVDLRAKVLIDMVEGNTAADLRRWTKNADPKWIAGIEVVATDLAESFRAGLSPKLDHAIRVADPFHVVRVGNRCLDKVRRRVQNETLGHRGRKVDPLYRIPSCSWPATNGSTTEVATGCSWACAWAIPMTRCWVPGWPRSPCATCTSPTMRRSPESCSTRPSPAAPATSSRRSAHSETRCRHGAPRSSPTTPPAPATALPRDSTSA